MGKVITTGYSRQIASVFEENLKVCIRFEEMRVELNRTELFNFLLTRSCRNISNKLFYNSVLKTFYTDIYDFIIKHFDEIECIQVYKDNAIHLYSGDRHYSELLVFEDYDFCNDEMNSKMLKELLTFCKKIVNNLK